jgi:predicted nucleotidyltransferase
MAEATHKKVHVFTDLEKKHIIDDFEYYNIKKELGPEEGQVLPTDPFAEQMLSSTQNVDLKNISSRSIILAPFNSTRSHISQDNDDKQIKQMMMPRNIIKFDVKVKEIDRQYELNNNAQLDNGVYHQSDEDSKSKQSDGSLDAN